MARTAILEKSYNPQQARVPAGQHGGGQFGSGGSPAKHPPGKPPPSGGSQPSKPSGKKPAKPAKPKTGGSKQQLQQQARDDIQQANQLEDQARGIRQQIATLNQKLSNLYRIASSGTGSSSSGAKTGTGTGTGSSAAGSTAASGAASGAAASGTSAARTSSTSPSSSGSASSSGTQAQISATKAQISSLTNQANQLDQEAAQLRQQAAQLNAQAAKMKMAGSPTIMTTATLEKAATLTGSGELTFFSFPIEKTETTADGDLVVYGKATDGSVDSDEQIVDPDFSAKAIQDWLASGGNVRVQHNPQRDPAGVGIAAEAGPDGSQWVKSLVVEPVAKTLVQKGALRAYSVGIAKPTIIRDAVARGGRITGGHIVEISLVDRPANKNCGIQLVKAAGDGTPEYTGKVFGADDVVAKAAGIDVDQLRGWPGIYPGSIDEELVKTVQIELPEDVQVAFTPMDLDKIIRHRNLNGKSVAVDEAAQQARAWYAELFGKKNFDPDVGGGVDRDKISDEDFAGEHRSFPVVTPGDVSDAASSLGRARGQSRGKIKENIKRIARRKGPEFEAQLPDSWKDGDGDDASKAAKMTCPKCGKKMKTGSAFCPGCGAKMAAEKGDGEPTKIIVEGHGDKDHDGDGLFDADGDGDGAVAKLPDEDSGKDGDDDSSEKAGKVTCPKCGTRNKAGSGTCKNCGASLDGNDDDDDDVTKAEGKDCTLCHGSGKIRAGHVTCPRCHGDGKISSGEPDEHGDTASEKAQAAADKAYQKAQRKAEEKAIREALLAEAGLVKGKDGDGKGDGDNKGMEEGLNPSGGSGGGDDEDEETDTGDTSIMEADAGKAEATPDLTKKPEKGSKPGKGKKGKGKKRGDGKLPFPGAAPPFGKKKDDDTPKNIELEVAKRQRQAGVTASWGALHDFTCAAYHPDVVSKFHPGITIYDLINTEEWQQAALSKAASAPLAEALMAQALWQASVLVRNSDPELILDMRHDLHKAFQDANPGPGTAITPIDMKPGKFCRPYLQAGHAAPSPGHEGPNTAAVPTGTPSASQYQRGYLTAGHSANSPSSQPRYSSIPDGMQPHVTSLDLNSRTPVTTMPASTKAGAAPDQPGTASSRGRRFYTRVAENNMRQALRSLHDHIAQTFPDLCAMSTAPEPVEEAMEKPEPNDVPVVTGPGKLPVGKSSRSGVRKDDADARVAAALSTMRTALGEALQYQQSDPDNETDPHDRQVWAHLEDLENALNNTIRDQHMDIGSEKSRMRQVRRLERAVMKGKVSLEDAQTILKASAPAVITKAATQDPVPEVTPDIIKAAVADAVEEHDRQLKAQFQSERKADRKKLRKLERQLGKMADMPHPGVTAFRGGYPPLAWQQQPVNETSAAPAGPPTMAETAERTQAMLLRKFEEDLRTNPDPAQRETAWAMICKIRGIQ